MSNTVLGITNDFICQSIVFGSFALHIAALVTARVPLESLLLWSLRLRLSKQMAPIIIGRYGTP